MSIDALSLTSRSQAPRGYFRGERPKNRERPVQAHGLRVLLFLVPLQLLGTVAALALGGAHRWSS
jgi:hypothetical protein